MKKRSAVLSLKLVALLFCLSILSYEDLAAQIVINEVVASNSSTIFDEDGDFPDWIEIYNPTDSVINLLGYGISDDPEEPFKYVLPDVELSSMQYYVLFASGKNRGNSTESNPKYWETVVREGDTTNYIIPSAPVSSDWITKDFDDSGWQEGPLGIGYGDNDDATTVPAGTGSIFTRTSFIIEDVSLIDSLLLHIDFDDGYVAYLNGVEVSRFNMIGASPIAYTSFSTDFITDPWLVRGEELPAISLHEFENLLVNGENVLAIQIHNSSAGSSDLSLIPFLSVARSVEPEDSRGTASQINLQNTGEALLHLNFKLSSSGETVLLTNPDSVVVDQLSYPQLKADESYGRGIGVDTALYIYTTPTPSAENDTQGYTERSLEPDLAQKGGFYADVFELQLLDPSKGDVVHFTVDGSDPTESSLKFGFDKRTISKTFTLKFITIEDGKLPSNIVAHTYIIGSDFDPPLTDGHDLPVVAVSTNPDNLWSDEFGIYVEGTNGISGNCTGPRNWNQDWEIPVTIEMYERDGTLGFSSGAGAKIFGGCSRTQPQKSLSIFFRSEYGNSELDYKLFEEKDIDKFQGFVLRNSGNDFNDTHFRDGLMKTLAQGTEIDYQAFRPVVVYLNGEYWGIHNIREKVNEHFIASNSEVKADDVDLVGPFIDEIIHGSDNSFRSFYDAISAANMQNETEYETIENLVDIDNYIDYMAAQIYYANTDWPGNNVKYWRDGVNNGKWRWIMYDTDFGFNHFNGGNHDPSLGNGVEHNTLRFALLSNRNNWPTYPWSTLVFRKFVENERFTDKFVNRMADLMNTSFQEEHMYAVIDSLSQIIDSEMPLHKERWGGSVESWNNRIDVLMNFAENRSENMEEFIKSEFDVLSRANLTVHVSSNIHGSVKVNRVIPKTYPWVGQYFGGVPVKVSAMAKPGYEFSGWSGSSSSSEPTIEVQAGAVLTANFIPSTSATSSIVINEIMYNASDEKESGDWIELFNNTSSTIDISGWVVKDEDDSHEFTFTSGTEMAAGAYAVIAADLSAFNTQYNNVSPLFGNLGFNLAGGSDEVRLYDDGDVLIDMLRYDDESPWDSVADGKGFTLELLNPDLENTLPGSWKASSQMMGTPGAPNSVLVVSNEPEQTLPSKIKLSQNYPNPFNPSTNIEFELPEQAKITLSVFDMLGRKVAVLADEIKSPGVYSVNWNASQQASGIYFYRLEVGKEIFSRKMLLIK